MDLLYRFEGHLKEIAPIGPVPGGLRLDIPFEGQLVDGALAGGRAWGVDYLLQRSDGVGEIDARDTFEVPGGHLHAKARGLVVPPPGIAGPSIEAMLARGFQPADVRLPITAFALCQTGVPAFEHLNRAVVKVDGWVNNATGELVFEGRAVEPATSIARGESVLAQAGGAPSRGRGFVQR